MNMYRTEFQGGGHAKRPTHTHPWTVYDETGAAVLSVEATFDAYGVRVIWNAYTTGMRIGFQRGRQFEIDCANAKMLAVRDASFAGGVPPSGLTP